MKRYLAIAATAVLGGALLAGCETATHPHSYDMAKQDFQSRNYPAAYAEVKGPARAGDPNAQYALGYMYFYGKGVEQSNEKAAYWFEKAAAQGHRGAMKALAKMQREGIVGRGMSEEHHMNRHRHHAMHSMEGEHHMNMEEEHHMKAKHKAKKHKAKKAAKAKKNADDTKKDSNDSDKATASASTDNGTATATTDQGTATASTDQTTDQGTATAGATS